MRYFAIRNATVGDLSNVNTEVLATSNFIDGTQYSLVLLKDSTVRLEYQGVSSEINVAYLNQLQLDSGFSVEDLIPSPHPYVGDGLPFAVVEYSSEEVDLLRKVPPTWTSWADLSDVEKSIVGQQIKNQDTLFGKGTIDLSIANGWILQGFEIAPPVSENLNLILISQSAIEAGLRSVPVLMYVLLDQYLPAEGFPLTSAQKLRNLALMHFAKWPRTVTLSGGIRIVNEGLFSDSEMSLPDQVTEVTEDIDVFPDSIYYVDTTLGDITLDLPPAELIKKPRKPIIIKRGLGLNNVIIQARAEISSIKTEPFIGFSAGDVLGLIIDGGLEITYTLLPGDIPSMLTAVGQIGILSPHFPTVDFDAIGTFVKRIRMRSQTQGSSGSLEIGPSTSASFLTAWGISVGVTSSGADFEGGSSERVLTSISEQVVEYGVGTISGDLTWVDLR